jgi:hypothetical protein
LFFKLLIRNGTITGDVFHSNTPGTRLSRVSGQCLSIPRPDHSVMDMLFTWGRVRVRLTGSVFLDTGDRRVKYKGRFHAFRPNGFSDTLQASEGGRANAAPPPIDPDDGDTGTGTGQQT